MKLETVNGVKTLTFKSGLKAEFMESGNVRINGEVVILSKEFADIASVRHVTRES